MRGEEAIKQINPAGAIIRTGWLYSEFGHNFLKTMLRLGQEREQISVVSDQIGTPTYATELAMALMTIAQSENGVSGDKSGSSANSQTVTTYHYANEGVASWYDFEHTIFELACIDCKVTPIESKQYPTPAKRPHYSVLNKAAIKRDFTLQIPHWRESLKQCVESVMQ